MTSVIAPRSGPPLGAGGDPGGGENVAPNREVMLDDECRTEGRDNVSHIDVPPVRAQRQTFETISGCKPPIAPFVGDFRVQIRVSQNALPSTCCWVKFENGSRLIDGKLCIDAGESSNTVGA